jgi:hypothetical protein
VVTDSLKCHASATSPDVGQDATFGVKVRTVAHAKMVAVYDKSLVTGQPTGQASAKGRHTLWFRATGAKPGSRVFIDVSVSRNDRTGACHTSFRLRPGTAAAAAAPSPTAVPSALPTRPAAPSRSSPPATHAACFPLSNKDACYAGNDGRRREPV